MKIIKPRKATIRVERYMNDKNGENKRLRLVLDLEGPLLEKFNTMRQDYGLVSGTDTLRIIIRELYEMKGMKEIKKEMEA